MASYGAADLARSFQTVRRNTIKIAEEIPEESYGFRAADGIRSVAEMLAHVAVSPRWQQRAHGQGITAIRFEDFAAGMARQRDEEQALTTKEQILDALRREGDELVAWLGTLSDAQLAETISFPPPVQPSTKTRFEMLLSVKEHEMHHRAQLMLIERMLGIVPHTTREMQERIASRERARAEGA